MKPLAPLISLCLFAASHADTAFLAHPRTTGKFATQSLSEGWGPYVHHPATQLIIKGGDGIERVVVDKGVLDVRRSRDGKSLLVTLVENYRVDPSSGIPSGNADLYRYHFDGTLTRLTNTPNIWECQPGELPDGKIGFLSNEDNWQNPHEGYRALTFYSMREDGLERKRVWHAGFGGVFGWSVGGDGWVYFASGENQGFRGGRGNHWPIWKIRPDGSGFEPVLTQVGDGNATDWVAMASRGTILAAYYYDTRIYGTILGVPRFEQTPFGPQSKFGDPLREKNPGARLRYYMQRFAWEARGLYNLTTDGHAQDEENKFKAADGSTIQGGMYSHPVAIPGNGIYYTHTGFDGDLNMDLGICVCADVSNPFNTAGIVTLIDEPNRHEWMATPICSDVDVYGAEIPNPKAKIDERLPKGAPLAFVGSSSVDKGEFIEIGSNTNLIPSKLIQPDPESIQYVRILGMEPTRYGRFAGMPVFMNGPVAQFWNNEGFSSEINEQVGVYADIPVSKWGATENGPVLHYGPHPPAGLVRIKRADGRLDTSWGAYIPADQVWSLQLLNDKKEAITGTTAQTWHQGISRENRNDCQGCHNHNEPDQTQFADTLAAKADYTPAKALSLIFTTREDLPPSIPSRPWVSNSAREGDGAIVARTYRSSESTLDDNPAFTQAEKLAVRRWIDTGMLEGPGAKTDTMEPTLVVDGRYVGALDPHSGLKSLTVDGQDVTALIDPATMIYTQPLPLPAQPVTFVATDNAGNVTEFVTKLAGEPTPVPKAEFIAFEDVMGDLRSRTPDGKKDYRVHLSGLQKRPIAFIDIKAGSDAAGTSFKWSNVAGEESPENPEGKWWLILGEPNIQSVVSDTRDIWFSNPYPDKPYASFRVYVVYSDTDINDRDFAAFDAPPAPKPEEPDDECDELQRQLDAANAQIESLNQKLDAGRKEAAETVKEAGETVEALK